MKLNLVKSSIIFLFFIGFKSLSAQYWAGLGYNITVPLGLKNLNYVVDRYNQTRDYLTKDMKNFSYTDGISARVGLWRKAMFLDVGYSGAGQRVFSVGTDPLPGSVEKQRDLKATFHTIDICYGKIIRNEAVNSIGIGVTAGLGTMRVRTRSEVPSNIKNAYYKDAVKQGMLTLGLVGRWMSSDPGVTFEPYVRFSFFGLAKANASDINEQINPNTFQNDPQKLNFNGTTIGIRVLLSITTKK